MWYFILGLAVGVLFTILGIFGLRMFLKAIHKTDYI